MKKTVIAVFASGANAEGSFFATSRELEFAKKAPRDGAVVIFAEKIVGWRPPDLFSKTLKDLLAEGVCAENIVVLSCRRGTEGTVEEMELMEAWLHEQSSKDIEVWACSTWYHLPRISLMWLVKFRRRVHFFPIWTLTDDDKIAFLLEPLKILLALLPAKCQLWLADILLRIWRKK